MIASAMAVYGKVGDAQAKTMAAKALEASQKAEKAEKAEYGDEKKQIAETPNEEMKRSMLANFESTQQKK